MCPSCGYKDVACWRSACWLKVASYCRLDELVVFDVELARLVGGLGVGEKVSRGGMTYRVTRSGNVYRIPDVLESVYSSHGYTESAPHSRVKVALSRRHFSSYKKDCQKKLVVE